MHPDQKAHFLALIETRQSQRNWSNLPADFERDAVKGIYRAMKDHFSQKGIKARIAASKAFTFDELKIALTK